MSQNHRRHPAVLLYFGAKAPLMSKIAVMIIDDSVTIRAMMEQVLIRDPRFEVAGIAAGVNEARAMMRSTSHDVVTLDLAMPGIGGIAFLDELSTKTHCPIVVVSSATRSGSSAEAEALEHGAFGCFDKSMLMSDVHGFLKLLQRAAKTKKPVG